MVVVPGRVEPLDHEKVIFFKAMLINTKIQILSIVLRPDTSFTS